MKLKLKKERADKYWICQDCVDKYGWETAYPEGGNTMTTGLCGWCDRKDETWLTPMSDFIKKKGDKVQWD